MVTSGGIAQANMTVELARSVSGVAADYVWSGTTDANGMVSIEIDVARSASGYYQARVKNASGAMVDHWTSIPLNGGQKVGLTLPVGARAMVTSTQNLTANLLGNSPNPFNPATQIAYELPEAMDVTLSIYNVQGQNIATLINQSQTAGRYQVTWDARDAIGREVSSGIYFYRLVANSVVQTRQMLLLK